MNFEEEQILQHYISRLLTLQDDREEWLDDDDLHAVARELGLSDAELERVHAVTEAHRQRGKNFSQHSAWDDAIAEYRQAVVLRPFDVALLYELAVAYASRWQAGHRPQDQEAATRYARRCIDLSPNHQASYELLAALKPATPASPTPGPPAARRTIALAAAGVVLLVGAAVAVFFVAPPPTPPTLPPPGPSSSPGSPSGSAPGAAPAPSEQQIPVRWVDAANHTGLRLDVQRSAFHTYPSSFSYTLHAALHVETDELHRLRLKLALLDAEGAILHTHHVDVRADHQPYLRPGDVAPIDALVYEQQPPPGLRAVELSIDLIEREPAAADYGTPPPLPITWAFSQPAHLDLAVYERESALRPSFRERMHFLTLAVRNKGTRSVQHLRLKVTWLDDQDTILTSELTYVVTSSGPAMRAGETWVARAIGKFPEGDTPPYARYAVSIAEAE